MNAKYFKEQINEELEGAKDYIELALTYRATNPEWATNFVDMSATELEHADKLYTMWNEYCAKNYPNSNSMVDEWKMCITDMYLDGVANVKSMHEFYNKSKPAVPLTK